MNNPVTNNNQEDTIETSNSDGIGMEKTELSTKETGKHGKDLGKKIKDLEQHNSELNQKNLRILADYQNMVKRMEKEKQDWIKFANESLLGRILDIADNLDRAAVFINDQGLHMVRAQMVQLLAEYGVQELEVMGKEFDPSIMECVDKSSGTKNYVLEVKQKGYMLHDKVLRPAKVVVGE